MIFHGISWYFMVFHGISWYFMIFHDISLRTTPAFSPGSKLSLDDELNEVSRIEQA